MKTTTYNPSPLEIEFTDILESLKDQIADKLNGNKILSFEKNTSVDNPLVRITLEDSEGDKHMVILKIIQKPDAMI